MTAFQSDFQHTLRMAESLPRDEQRLLAEELLRQGEASSLESILVIRRRLAPEVQQRMDHLLAKNNEGTLTPDEREELVQLVDNYEQVMLHNTEALLRASQTSLLPKGRQDDIAEPVTERYESVGSRIRPL